MRRSRLEPVEQNGRHKMKAFVITIFGLPHSERGAEALLDSARTHGVDVERFTATTRYDAEAAMRDADLSFDRQFFDRISDEPIGDRDKTPKGHWHLTTPEIGCFMSHYRLWQVCSAENAPVVIFEHDVRLVAPLPPLIPGMLALSFESAAMVSSAGYIMTPAGADILLRMATQHGIRPADEMVWRSPYLAGRRLYCDPSIIEHRDGGVSTIQFSRNDEVHIALQKSDPWDDYVPS